jgi:hypothetical protein
VGPSWSWPIVTDRAKQDPESQRVRGGSDAPLRKQATSAREVQKRSHVPASPCCSTPGRR